MADLTTDLALWLRGFIAGALEMISGGSSGTEASFASTRSGDTLTSQSTGGVDETLASNYEAFRFTMSGTEMGAVSVSLKRDSGTTGGTISAYLYSDSAGPSADISDTSTGLPSIIYVANLLTTYASVEFRLPKTGMTDGANYWVVLRMTGITGGNVYIERRSSGTGLYAFSADGAAWTTENSKQPVYIISGNGGRALSGFSDSGDGVYGESTSGFGGHFVSGIGPGIKADSIYNFGVGGSSMYGIGVRASSVNNIAGQFVSTGSAGLQVQTTANGSVGAQFVSTTGAAFQAAPTTGAAVQYVPQAAVAGGAGWTDGYAAEVITLSGGTTSDSSAGLIPAGAFVYAVAWRITTTISGGTATAFTIGTAADSDVFEGVTSTLTAGTTGYGINTGATFAGPFGYPTASVVRVTTNGTTTAGAVRVVVFYRTITPPSS